MSESNVTAFFNKKTVYLKEISEYESSYYSESGEDNGDGSGPFYKYVVSLCETCGYIVLLCETYSILLNNFLNKLCNRSLKMQVENINDHIKAGQFVIVRSARAGVFAGNIIKVEGNVVFMDNAIRLWYWSGAASLSQLATMGVKNPDECKFSVPEKMKMINNWEEITICTPEAEDNIKAVPSWVV